MRANQGEEGDYPHHLADTDAATVRRAAHTTPLCASVSTCLRVTHAERIPVDQRIHAATASNANGSHERRAVCVELHIECSIIVPELPLVEGEERLARTVANDSDIVEPTAKRGNAKPDAEKERAKPNENR